MMQRAAAGGAGMLGQAAGLQHRHHLVLTVWTAHGSGGFERDDALVSCGSGDGRRFEPDGVALVARHSTRGCGWSLAGGEQASQGECGSEEQRVFQCFHGLWSVSCVVGLGCRRSLRKVAMKCDLIRILSRDNAMPLVEHIGRLCVSPIHAD